MPQLQMTEAKYRMTSSSTAAHAVGFADLAHFSRSCRRMLGYTPTALRRGLAMLGREIDRPGDKRPPDLYFLWSLERVGVLFNLPKIEDKDWYAWGAKALLAKQARDDSWAGSSYFGSSSIVDTCFALLFLKQANLAQDLTAKLQLLAEQK